MEITLKIKTDERYSNMDNLLSLLEMVLEDVNRNMHPPVYQRGFVENYIGPDGTDYNAGYELKVGA